MKKSVDLYFKEKGNEKEKILAIKKAGFDEFFTLYDDEGCELTFKEQCVFASSLGLKCTMIHGKYNSSDLHCFWKIGKQGDDVCNFYIHQIEQCSGLTNNFVVHLNADVNQKQTAIGLSRITKMLKACEKYNINLCIENAESEKEIPYIFSKLNHERLKICFDIGHKNCFTPNLDVLNKYGNFVQVLHLHDNHGEKDEHLMCGKGNINWNDFAKQIKVFPNLVLASEVKYLKDKNSKVLKHIYKSLKKIDNQIKKVRVK